MAACLEGHGREFAHKLAPVVDHPHSEYALCVHPLQRVNELRVAMHGCELLSSLSLRAGRRVSPEPSACIGNGPAKPASQPEHG